MKPQTRRSGSHRKAFGGLAGPVKALREASPQAHVKVEWEVTVADDKGVTHGEVWQKYTYGLPVRNVFCGIYRPDIADWIAGELQHRAGER